MIVVKDLRVNVLGEPLFEKVNLVVRSDERVALVGSVLDNVSTLLRVLAGEEDADRGMTTYDGERIAYVSPEMFREGGPALGRLHHTRPTFIFIDATALDTGEQAIGDLERFIQGYRGGLMVASSHNRLITSARVTRVFELQPLVKTVTTYTGNYADFLVEQEKNRARLAEAYEKQQREKRKLEEYLEQKRREAGKAKSSPEKGAIVRAKTKYLQREILDKEIPDPTQFG